MKSYRWKIPSFKSGHGHQRRGLILRWFYSHASDPQRETQSCLHGHFAVKQIYGHKFAFYPYHLSLLRVYLNQEGRIRARRGAQLLALPTGRGHGAEIQRLTRTAEHGRATRSRTCPGGCRCCEFGSSRRPGSPWHSWNRRQRGRCSEALRAGRASARVVQIRANDPNPTCAGGLILGLQASTTAL